MVAPRLYNGNFRAADFGAKGLPQAEPEMGIVEFSYCSDGRVAVICGDDVIVLPPADAVRLKLFLSQLPLGEGEPC